jgi:hypothetical protein
METDSSFVVREANLLFTYSTESSRFTIIHVSAALVAPSTHYAQIDCQKKMPEVLWEFGA